MGIATVLFVALNWKGKKNIIILYYLEKKD
jgi:hypothetical protein